MECSCESCARACLNRPGYFAPGEAIKAAEFLGLTLREFFDKYLVVDFQTDHTGLKVSYYLLMPATVGEQGTVAGYIPKRGRCIFLNKENRCDIHSVKPKECRLYDHTVVKRDAEANHQMVASDWREAQQEVFAAIGRKLRKQRFPPMSTAALWVAMMG